MEKITITAVEYGQLYAKIRSLENENYRLKEQLRTLDVVRQSEQCSGCEESTGETKLWCCNHCGKRIEDF